MMIEELDSAWLSGILGTDVVLRAAERVGTGQIGTCYRLTLDGAGLPPTLLAKLPAEDPAQRAMLAGAYRGETRFYRDLAHTVAIRVPRVWHASEVTDEGSFVLLLEDLAPAEQGDQLGGCSVAEARGAVMNLAGLHGPRWCDPTLLDVEGLSVNGPDEAALMEEFFGQAVDIFVDGLGDLLTPDTVSTLRDLAGGIGDWALGRSERFALVHGDYRLDNLLFPPGDPDGVVAVDWQTLSLALPARDLAFFAGTSLLPEIRREHEQGLLATYHQALLAHGVTGYSLEECWSDYVFALPQGPLVAVFGCAYGTRTERGDRMFAAMTNRSCTAIRELA